MPGDPFPGHHGILGPSVPNSAAAVIVTDVCPAHYNDIIHIQTLLLLLVLGGGSPYGLFLAESEYAKIL